MKLEKYHGLGNDYLVLDANLCDAPPSPAQIRLICDRNFGFGSDGILYGPTEQSGRPALRIFNPDGSEAEKSGNGVRIFSKYLKDAGYISSDSFTLSTPGGEVDVSYLNDDGSLMRVLMGKTTCLSSLIPVSGEAREVIDEEMCFAGSKHRVTCVSIGNPHCVIPVKRATKELALSLGDSVENAPQFPNKINMQLLEVVDRHNIKIEIYERGAGYTLASGSSSCAAATAAYRLGLVDSEVTVHMPGGKLKIEILPDSSVYMTGEVSSVGSMLTSREFEEKLRLLG